MNHSTSYLAIDLLIQKGWVMIGMPEFDQALHKFRALGQISLSEHQHLLLRFAIKGAETGNSKPAR